MTWSQEADEVAAYCGRPGRFLDPHEDPFIRRGAVRPRIQVHVSWEGGLTERQKKLGNKARTARAWGRMMQIMERTGVSMEEYVQGLSNEELARGQLRDRDGSFRGRPPAWVPREFHRECLRELMRRGRALWQENYVVAIRVMTQVASGDIKGATVADRVRAAQYVVERMEGKIPERVEIQVDAPWQDAIADIVAEVSDEQIAAARRVLASAERADDAEDEVIDAEVVPARARRAPARRRR